jgi:hypothetical protein
MICRQFGRSAGEWFVTVLTRKLTFSPAIMQVADMVDADRPSSAEQLTALRAGSSRSISRHYGATKSHRWAADQEASCVVLVQVPPSTPLFCLIICGKDEPSEVGRGGHPLRRGFLREGSRLSRRFDHFVVVVVFFLVVAFFGAGFGVTTTFSVFTSLVVLPTFS